jgi:hypothetical protein
MDIVGERIMTTSPRDKCFDRFEAFLRDVKPVEEDMLAAKARAKREVSAIIDAAQRAEITAQEAFDMILQMSKWLFEKKSYTLDIELCIDGEYYELYLEEERYQDVDLLDRMRWRTRSGNMTLVDRNHKSFEVRMDERNKLALLVGWRSAGLYGSYINDW